MNRMSKIIRRAVLKKLLREKTDSTKPQEKEKQESREELQLRCTQSNLQTTKTTK
jgi:hypothetical protein